MSNPYYTFSPTLTPGTRARSDAVNLQFQHIETAFDNLPTLQGAITRGLSTFGTEAQGATVNNFEVTLGDTRTSNQEGDAVVFKATHTNTGASTLNVDGIGAVPFVAFNGNSMLAGALVINRYYETRFDATNTRFMLMCSADESLMIEDLADVAFVAPVAGEVLTYTGTSWTNAAGGGGGGGGGGIGGGVDVQVFTTSDNWSKPTGAGIVEVYVVGGGGGGGSGRKRTVAANVGGSGSGGQGGGISFGRFRASTLNSVESVTVAGVAAGGAARTTVNDGFAGTAGGDSKFGTGGLVIARGGAAGRGGGTSTANLAGGTGLGAGDVSVGLNGGFGDDTTGGPGEPIQQSATLTTQTAELLQCGGGGGGGGVSSAGAAAVGGDGSLFGDAYTPEQAAWNGQNGIASQDGFPGGTFRGDFGAGGGGGGGGGSITTNGGSGGAGGAPGGGGGGGGGAIDTFGNSGSGGAGGRGVVVVVTYLTGTGGSFTVVGGADALHVKEEGVAVGTTYDTLNFVGAGVTATNEGGGIARITIPTVSPTYRGAAAWVDHNGGGAVAVPQFTGSNTVALAFDNQYADTDAIFAPTSANMTVPAGVTKIRLIGQVRFNDFGVAGTGTRSAVFFKNAALLSDPSSATFAVSTKAYSDTVALDTELHIATHTLTVTAGDVFQLRAYQTNSPGTTINAGGFLEMIIVQ